MLHPSIRIVLLAVLVSIWTTIPALSANLVGDADHDGVFSPNDAAVVQDALLGILPPTSVSPLGMMDADSDLDLADLLLVAQNAQLGLDDYAGPGNLLTVSSYGNFSTWDGAAPTLLVWGFSSNFPGLADLVDGLEVTVEIASPGAESLLANVDVEVNAGFVMADFAPINTTNGPVFINVRMYIGIRDSDGSSVVETHLDNLWVEVGPLHPDAPNWCQQVEDTYNAVVAELDAELQALKTAAISNGSLLSCQPAIDNVVWRHSGASGVGACWDLFLGSNDCATAVPGSETDPFDPIAPAVVASPPSLGAVGIDCSAPGADCSTPVGCKVAVTRDLTWQSVCGEATPVSVMLDNDITFEETQTKCNETKSNLDIIAAELDAEFELLKTALPSTPWLTCMDAINNVIYRHSGDSPSYCGMCTNLMGSFPDPCFNPGGTETDPFNSVACAVDSGSPLFSFSGQIGIDCTGPGADCTIPTQCKAYVSRDLSWEPICGEPGPVGVLVDRSTTPTETMAKCDETRTNYDAVVAELDAEFELLKSAVQAGAPWGCQEAIENVVWRHTGGMPFGGCGGCTDLMPGSNDCATAIPGTDIDPFEPWNCGVYEFPAGGFDGLVGIDCSAPGADCSNPMDCRVVVNRDLAWEPLCGEVNPVEVLVEGTDATETQAMCMEIQINFDLIVAELDAEFEILKDAVAAGSPWGCQEAVDNVVGRHSGMLGYGGCIDLMPGSTDCASAIPGSEVDPFYPYPFNPAVHGQGPPLSPGGIGIDCFSGGADCSDPMDCKVTVSRNLDWEPFCGEINPVEVLVEGTDATETQAMCMEIQINFDLIVAELDAEFEILKDAVAAGSPWGCQEAVDNVVGRHSGMLGYGGCIDLMPGSTDCASAIPGSEVDPFYPYPFNPAVHGQGPPLSPGGIGIDCFSGGADCSDPMDCKVTVSRNLDWEPFCGEINPVEVLVEGTDATETQAMCMEIQINFDLIVAELDAEFEILKDAVAAGSPWGCQEAVDNVVGRHSGMLGYGGCIDLMPGSTDCASAIPGSEVDPFYPYPFNPAVHGQGPPLSPGGIGIDCFSGGADCSDPMDCKVTVSRNLDWEPFCGEINPVEVLVEGTDATETQAMCLETTLNFDAVVAELDAEFEILKDAVAAGSPWGCQEAVDNVVGRHSGMLGYGGCIDLMPGSTDCASAIPGSEVDPFYPYPFNPAVHGQGPPLSPGGIGIDCFSGGADCSDPMDCKVTVSRNLDWEPFCGEINPVEVLVEGTDATETQAMCLETTLNFDAVVAELDAEFEILKDAVAAGAPWGCQEAIENVVWRHSGAIGFGACTDLMPGSTDCASAIPGSEVDPFEPYPTVPAVWDGGSPFSVGGVGIGCFSGGADCSNPMDCKVVVNRDLDWEPLCGEIGPVEVLVEGTSTAETILMCEEVTDSYDALLTEIGDDIRAAELANHFGAGPFDCQQVVDGIIWKHTGEALCVDLYPFYCPASPLGEANPFDPLWAAIVLNAPPPTGSISLTCDDPGALQNMVVNIERDLTGEPLCGEAATTGETIIEFYCGNYLMDAPVEVCDDGFANGAGDGFCTADCQGVQVCGDGLTTGTELCDDGASNGAGDGFCLADCSDMQICGDAATVGSEACDDGDTDDCTPACDQFCSGPYPLQCGDGVVECAEMCDDFNLINGDGCSDVCAIELGGATLYAIDENTGDLLTLDVAAGTVNFIGITGYSGIRSAAYTGAGTLYATQSGSDQLLSVDPLTALTTPLGSLGAGPWDITALAYDGFDLYGFNDPDNGYYYIDTVSPSALFASPVSYDQVEAMSYDSSFTLTCYDNATGDLFETVPGVPLGTMAETFGAFQHTPNDYLLAVDTVNSALVHVDPITLSAYFVMDLSGYSIKALALIP